MDDGIPRSFRTPKHPAPRPGIMQALKTAMMQHWHLRHDRAGEFHAAINGAVPHATLSEWNLSVLQIERELKGELAL